VYDQEVLAFEAPSGRRVGLFQSFGSLPKDSQSGLLGTSVSGKTNRPSTVEAVGDSPCLKFTSHYEITSAKGPPEQGRGRRRCLGKGTAEG
jgi:hypothetical protein